MRRTAALTNAQNSTDDVDPLAICESEALQLRKEKLEAIRSAIAAGDYDSDDVLEKALSRMLERIDIPDQATHP